MTDDEETRRAGENVRNFFATVQRELGGCYLKLTLGRERWGDVPEAACLVHLGFAGTPTCVRIRSAIDLGEPATDERQSQVFAAHFCTRDVTALFGKLKVQDSPRPGVVDVGPESILPRKLEGPSHVQAAFGLSGFAAERCCLTKQRGPGTVAFVFSRGRNASPNAARSSSDRARVR